MPKSWLGLGTASLLDSAAMPLFHVLSDAMGPNPTSQRFTAWFRAAHLLASFNG